MSNSAQQTLADRLTGTSIITGAGVSLAEFNAYLETGTLIVGLLAGLFALFFHARRWYRDRCEAKEQKDEK